ncbi:GerAB/ArcD/ProY family transporter [Brevibacillus massiliensis]|uniref:GerAB/ArcD/ProY family transporter n=1 Tax=Brevibacillus massiliensis TaxID=1118054 RepID=UPI0002E5F17C|nr:endospore germination permease [Brevibacillus massiliensis]
MSRNQSSSTDKTMSTWQLASLITSTLIGVGVLTLPRTSTERLAEQGWMAPLAGGGIALAATLLIAWLSRRYPGLTFIQYSEVIWGSRKSRWLGKLISLPWVLLYLAHLYIGTAITSRLFGEVVVTAVLRETPIEAIIITMFCLALFLCLHDVEVVSRVNELLFLLILFPVLIIGLLSFQKADWNQILPLFSASFPDVFKGAVETAFTYQGYEVMLIFFAFAQPVARKSQAGFIGIAVAIGVYTLITMSGIAVFGVDEMQKLTWPTLEIVKTTQMPGLVLERLESAFLGVWVAAVFTTISNTYYAFNLGLRQFFGRGMVFQRIMSLLLMFPLFYLALIPQNIVQIFRVSRMSGYIGLVVGLGLPLLYLAVSLMRRQGNRVKEKGKVAR